MSQHISEASFQHNPTKAQRDANSAAQAALNIVIVNVPEPADVEAAQEAALELLSVLAADDSESAQVEYQKLIAVINGMQTVEEVNLIFERAQGMLPVDLHNPTALEMVHDTALRENLTRMLGGVWTHAEWQSLTRRLRRRLLELQPRQA